MADRTELIEPPLRLWLSAPDTDNEHDVWFDPDEGGTEYIRADCREAIAALRADGAGVDVNHEELASIKCRFGCVEVVGIYHVPEGCLCWTDPIQALCAQHSEKAESNGPITAILSRAAALPPAPDAALNGEG